MTFKDKTYVPYMKSKAIKYITINKKPLAVVPALLSDIPPPYSYYTDPILLKIKIS